MPLSFAVGPKRRYAGRPGMGRPALPPAPAFEPPKPIGPPRPQNMPQVLQTPEPTPQRRQLAATVFLGSPQATSPAPVQPVTRALPSITAGRVSPFSLPTIRLPSLNIPSTQAILQQAQGAIQSFLDRTRQAVQAQQRAAQPITPSIGELRRMEGGVAIPTNLRGYFETASRQTGVPTSLLAAMARVESGFRPNAVSPAGAIGLMQLMPATARGLGVNPHDPAQNVLGGARYIAQQLQRFGDLRLALAAYNAGPGRVSQAIRRAGTTAWSAIQRYLPAETRRYVDLVLRYY